jgi:endogenous inhibitor of DNA gyrase (YacG/DUF329 family)
LGKCSAELIKSLSIRFFTGSLFHSALFRANILSDCGHWPFTNSMSPRKKPAKLLHCPTCGMIVRPNDDDFPFCIDRCRKIDLGKWATGVYKISSPVLDPEVLEDLGLLGDNRGGGSDER